MPSCVCKISFKSVQVCGCCCKMFRGLTFSGTQCTIILHFSVIRDVCVKAATLHLLLFKGYAAGPHHNQVGSGSNFLCLPEQPQWKTYLAGSQAQSTAGTIAGIEYELFDSGIYHNNIFSESNNGGNPLLNNPAPCAVCYVGGRSTILMIPARTQCPDGWTAEYAGYLVSEARRYDRRSSYVCWDEAPEVATGPVNQNNAVIYPVEVLCGSLPCSVYFTGRELTCIVCSK